MEHNRPSDMKVIPRGYVALHVVMADMEERRMYNLRYFVAPGPLQDAISASATSAAYGPHTYSDESGFESEELAVVYCGVAKHYAEITKHKGMHNTFVGASMDAMAPMEDVPRLKDKKMLSVTVALTTADVVAINELE